MQACVEVWESDPAAYHYNSVGYIALGAAVQESDLAATFERQERIGYRSELIAGEAEVDAHMKALFPDWRAQGVTICLHEHQGGFAFNVESVLGLRDKCLGEGVSVARRRRGHRLRLTRRRLGVRGGDERRRDRGRRAGRHRPGPVGGEVLVAARHAGHDRHHHSVRRRRPRPPDVDVLEPPGGRDHGRPAHVRDRRRWRAPRDPPRHRRAAPHGRRRPRDRRALGDLLQARSPRRAGRRLAAGRRRRRRARPVPVDDGRRSAASPTCGAPRSRIR